MSEKKRLDVILVERGLAQSREKAKAVIMSGNVFVSGQKADKSGETFPEDIDIDVRGNEASYVSRGGLKIEKALDFFSATVDGKLTIDVGASTGGFTDCLLRRGAKKVYSVDVGYGQLAWSLRCDPRVVCLERTNIRYVTHEQVPDIIELAVIDVSFISLKLVLPAVRALMADDGNVYCLIKPQFEAGREKVGKKGVVRDPEVHAEVLENFIKNAENSGFSVRGITFSPITGPEGNIEFLGSLCCGDEKSADIDISTIVSEAHNSLKG
ncbi:MAG: TlyA family RNA methyltransferase [Oscillospiraceae bacterium]|nr:TlyA family RNA methyltransferase [Oscillospiraceae bacterium]